MKNCKTLLWNRPNSWKLFHVWSIFNYYKTVFVMLQFSMSVYGPSLVILFNHYPIYPFTSIPRGTKLLHSTLSLFISTIEAPNLESYVSQLCPIVSDFVLGVCSAMSVTFVGLLPHLFRWRFRDILFIYLPRVLWGFLNLFMFLFRFSW